MIRMWSLIKFELEPKTYLWVNVIFVRETPKAILIVFDCRKAWIPKTWICHIKRKNDYRVIASPPKTGIAISIKISDYHLAKKFA